MHTSPSSVLRFTRRLLGLCLATALFAQAWAAEDGQWKTIFYKRTFVGAIDVKSKEGTGTTVRMPVTIPFNAEKIRVWVRSDFDVPIELSRLTLVRASGEKGAIQGAPVPLLFDGEKPGTKLAQKESKNSVANGAGALTPGLWYLETHYTSDKCSYSYDADGGYSAAGDSLTDSSAKFRLSKVFMGNAYRVDVFTTDPTPVLVCYGDSITQGSGSTPMSGKNYPHQLGVLLKRPVVNLGINSDLVIHAGGAGDLATRMKGATDFIFLMGINDIAWGGQIKSAADYSARVTPILATVKKSGMKAYLATIPPAGGMPLFDRKPSKEALRQEINAWIRKQTRADAVIDFDEALRDPANPVRLRAEYHCGDWIHPSDLGYEKMAEAAAAVLKSK